MTAPTIYRSDDASAPTISGTSSDLRLALNAILVDGYGAKAAAGWAKAYEDAGNHLVAYRNAGLGRYLFLDDSPTRVSVLRGYRAMASISDRSEPFPRLGLPDVTCRKSVTADATARPWICLANELHFFLIIFGNQTTLGSSSGSDAHLAFGELDSALPGDEYRTFIHGGSDTSATSGTATVARQAFNFNDTSVVTSPYTFCEGTIAQNALSTNSVSEAAPFANTPFSEVVSGGTTFPAYPDPATGKLLISRQMTRHIHATSAPVNRGYLPGLWTLCHPATSFTSLDTFSMGSRTFLIVRTGAGGVVFETTGDSW